MSVIRKSESGTETVKFIFSPGHILPAFFAFLTPLATDCVVTMHLFYSLYFILSFQKEALSFITSTEN